jgi:hypothetical protein
MRGSTFLRGCSAATPGVLALVLACSGSSSSSAPAADAGPDSSSDAGVGLTCAKLLSCDQACGPSSTAGDVAHAGASGSRLPPGTSTRIAPSAYGAMRRGAQEIVARSAAQRRRRREPTYSFS